MNEEAAVLQRSRKFWERNPLPFSGVLEQNQEVKKPAQFKLQRVEKESWQLAESGREGVRKESSRRGERKKEKGNEKGGKMRRGKFESEKRKRLSDES